MKFHHIGYIVSNLENSIKGFNNLGYTPSPVYIDDFQEIEIVILTKNNFPTIELIKPSFDNHPLNRYKNKLQYSNPYHLAFQTKSILKEIKVLRSSRFIPTMKISKAVAFNDVPFIFLLEKHVGIIELLEIK